MKKNKPAKAKRPPLSAYIEAGMPVLRLVALLERTADLEPGSMMRDFQLSVEIKHVLNVAAAWAKWIASNYAHEDGSSYTDEDEAALAAKIEQLLRP